MPWFSVTTLVQFPTLGFVVERFWEIQSHEPEEFWTINCTHNSEEGTATFTWMWPKIYIKLVSSVILVQRLIAFRRQRICKLWCKSSKDIHIQYGVLMLSGYWILKRVSREILVVADMMTKPSLDGVGITMDSVEGEPY